MTKAEIIEKIRMIEKNLFDLSQTKGADEYNWAYDRLIKNADELPIYEAIIKKYKLTQSQLALLNYCIKEVRRVRSYGYR